MKLYMRRPVKSDFPISSPFGIERTLLGTKKEHHGIDFACPVGTPVYAMFNSSVFKVGYENESCPKQGLGLRIWTRLKFNGKWFYAWYGHLSKAEVEIDDYLKEGQKIGETGNTGHSTGPHLHVQFRQVDTGDWFDCDFRES